MACPNEIRDPGLNTDHRVRLPEDRVHELYVRALVRYTQAKQKVIYGPVRVCWTQGEKEREGDELKLTLVNESLRQQRECSSIMLEAESSRSPAASLCLVPGDRIYQTRGRG